TVLQYLADINRELGITVVVVTHEMEVVKALTDHVAVMEAGRIVERFPAPQLHDPGFAPATAIGKYLVSDGIRVERGAKGDDTSTVQCGLDQANDYIPFTVV